MKILTTIGLSTALAAASLVLPITSVNAQMSQEQNQHVTQSSSFSFNCNGNCNTSSSNSSANFSSSSEVHQSQSQSTGWGGYMHSLKNHYKNNPNKSMNGKVTVGWDYEGGTCHVQYTEANVTNYKYNTSAPCDDGEVTISGLKRGGLYRFQVKKDDGAWSDPMTLRAY